MLGLYKYGNGDSTQTNGDVSAWQIWYGKADYRL